MGDNEIKLVKTYLALTEELAKVKERAESRKILGQMKGMESAYEIYTGNSFKSLIEKWEWFSNRR